MVVFLEHSSAVVALVAQFRRTPGLLQHESSEFARASLACAAGWGLAVEACAVAAQSEAAAKALVADEFAATHKAGWTARLLDAIDQLCAQEMHSWLQLPDGLRGVASGFGWMRGTASAASLSTAEVNGVYSLWTRLCKVLPQHSAELLVEVADELLCSQNIEELAMMNALQACTTEVAFAESARYIFSFLCHLS